jgi:uncharacterized protein (TIGR03067 family)
MFTVLASAALPLLAQKPGADSFSLSIGDITEAIISTAAPPQLKVILTPQKSAELASFTELNLNKRVKIIVGGKLCSEPFIRERMAGPSMELYVASTDDALAIVNALLTSRLKFDQLYKWTDNSGQTHYSERPPVPSPGLPAQAGEATDAQTRRLLEELQGAWVVSSATMNGKVRADRSLLEAHWIFQGNELVLQLPEKGTVRFAVNLDAKAEPKAFHLTSIEPVNSGSGWMLFKREGDKLKIAYHDNLEGRPERFEPSQPHAKPELVVVTLERKK